MNQNLVLHVGRHKSGTTAIQHFLSGNTRALAESGVIYPATGRIGADGTLKPAHHRIAEVCNPKHFDRDLFDSLKIQLAKETQGYGTIIISSEAFQNIADLSLLVEFFDGLAIFDVNVVCYIREYLDYLVSGFRQMAQNQNRFRTFGQLCALPPRIEEYLEKWSGIGTLVARPFERTSLKDGDIVADFLDAAAIELEPGKPKQFNPSVGGNLLFFRMVEQRHGIRVTPYRRSNVLASRNKAFQMPFHIPDNVAASIREDSPYNEVVEKHLGPLTLKSFEAFPAIPDHASVEHDISLIYHKADRAFMRKLILDSLYEAVMWFDPSSPDRIA